MRLLIGAVLSTSHNMAVAKSGSELFCTRISRNARSFPSFYGSSHVVRAFRVQKEGFVKRLCYSHRYLSVTEEFGTTIRVTIDELAPQ
jgi:hypothetical protein